MCMEPSGVVDDFAAFFHEGDRAEHCADTTSKGWERQHHLANLIHEALWAKLGASSTARGR